MSLNEISELARFLISGGLILVGLFFLLVASVGILRLPDVFTRCHAVSLTDSLVHFSSWGDWLFTRVSVRTWQRFLLFWFSCTCSIR